MGYQAIYRTFKTPIKESVFVLNFDKFSQLSNCARRQAYVMWIVSVGCAHGDYRGLFQIGRRSLRCSQIGAAQAEYKCYEKDFASGCCETCQRIRRTDKPGESSKRFATRL